MFEKFAEDVQRRYQEKIAEFADFIEKWAAAGLPVGAIPMDLFKGGFNLQSLRAAYPRFNTAQRKNLRAMVQGSKFYTPEIGRMFDAMETNANAVRRSVQKSQVGAATTGMAHWGTWIR